MQIGTDGEKGNITCGDVGFKGLNPLFRLLMFCKTDTEDNQKNKSNIHAIFIHPSAFQTCDTKNTKNLIKTGFDMQTLKEFLYIASIDTIIDLSQAPSATHSNSKGRGVSPLTLNLAIRVVQSLEPFFLHEVFQINKDQPSFKVLETVDIRGLITGEK